jgi:hypothetical protein
MARRTWAVSTNPEAVKYLVSNPWGHENELLCSMNIKTLVIGIVLGSSGRAVRKQEIESDMQVSAFVSV